MSKDFDYIIVGGGTAGCILANRLSRNPSNKVLLLEAGPSDRSFWIDMPRGVGKITRPGGAFVSTYEAKKGEGLGSEPWMKGRVLGGSSSVNGMIYSRGHPEDFDAWKAAGCVGWGWDDIGACYRAIEDHELGAEAFRGAGGPLRITVHKPHSGTQRICEAVLNAAEQAGTPRVADINNAYDGGFGYQPRNIHGSRRQGAGRAFLKPALNRPNLEVRTGVTARRILFDGRRAVGVRVRDAAGENDIRTAGEIILSAGAIETPRLLQISGVGDATRLQKLGIPVVVNSPEVGLNMQEHLYLQVQYRVTEGSMNAKLSTVSRGGPGQWLEGVNYLLRRGVMTDGAHEMSGFVRTRPDSTRPDAHLGVSLYSMKITEKGFEWDAAPGMTFGAYPMRPTSRGHILITTPDPDGALDIDCNYLATEEDRRDAVSTVRYIRHIAGQPALRPYVREELNPGTAVQDEEEIINVWKQQGMRGFHVCSTARMGGDERSVVDPQLRVRGVEGLRVVDTSIFPAITSGNTNAPVMASALRASEIILGENSRGSW